VTPTARTKRAVKRDRVRLLMGNISLRPRGVMLWL
jgi:hypothetical protein